ncbi:MAG: type III-A CRISPR-associated RAMP protein Csm5 [Acidobacteriota bacterium]|nr:type III-A CRISPR-associated RAMP protein Csm5 [Acidobacteriota bacterium]
MEHFEVEHEECPVNYRLTVLTPTLVGNGDKLSPIDYMVWRDQVNVLDQPRIFRLLSKGPRLEGYLEQLRKATKLDFASWGGFAQNYADRRIPFEDPSYTLYWERAQAESLSIPTFAVSKEGPYLPGAAVKGALRTAWIFAHAKASALTELAEKPSRRPAERMEQQSAGSGGSDRMRAISVADSGAKTRDPFRIYMLRLAILTAKAPQQYALGWKQTGRGAVDGRRPDDGTPTFAEMADPGASFEGIWRENAFLNREEVRQVLRWSGPVTHERLFDAANRYAEKQLELHAQYAAWTGLETLATSISALQAKLAEARTNGGCLLAIGWGAGFLSKSAAIGIEEQEHRKVLETLPYYEQAIKSGLPFPKTRRIVFLKNKPATLPGWVELKIAG